MAAVRNKAKTYSEAVREYEECLAIDTLLSPATCGAPPPQPELSTQLANIEEDPPVLPSRTIAYMAVAQLTLHPAQPGIGPSPDINPWKMAAVGYPLWLWGDGATDPLPVTSQAAGLSVGLDARIEKIVFVMGDGHAVTCIGTGTAWTRGVRPGSESPTCGYRYQKPSLPRARYTVTAKTYWAVDWETNGDTGTIRIVQEAATELPVGELQVLVR